MNDERLEKLLPDLSKLTEEYVRPELADEIKQHIPGNLRSHRKAINTINIIIDFRINKLAAVAAIIITMVLCMNLIGGRDASGEGVFKDSKLLLQYFLGSKSDLNNQANISKYTYLANQGKEVTYYGEARDLDDSNAILMHWKLSEGSYRVLFTDLREETVDAEQLIKLQAQMLQKKVK